MSTDLSANAAMNSGEDMPASELVCAGCDVVIPQHEWLAFSCPSRDRGEHQDDASNASQTSHGDTDHVLALHVGAEAMRAGWPTTLLQGNENPFVRYRKLSHTWHQALAAGMQDSEYLAVSSDLFRALTDVGDAPPSVTPLHYSEELRISIKNETVNISGSHKVRHLIGTALHLQIAQHLGAKTRDIPLAIASCGNAALAAAIVARAAKRELRVFVPPNAAQSVLTKLSALGAHLEVCPRSESDPPGDPCYLRFVEAVRGGALPFSCQGGDNAYALIGGHTLGWELIEQLRERPASDLFVQVGGGALASSLTQALSMAKRAGLLMRMPRIHAVQCSNAHPLVRAWLKFKASGLTLEQARRRRSEFMSPWESEPRSVASGILDDETYDWMAIFKALVASEGNASTVSEGQLIAAQQLAERVTGIAVDATGTAGFAGLLKARESGEVSQSSHALVLFTGAIR